ncbi:phage tail tape-measure protein [Rhodobacteraceae bacterium WD3A24]|nr:phage tail tape-measure protein [Rhodobacteraceae bacterium WD3A24]
MAEKRVNVRLAAVGGRQVKRALEGVGEAGRRGMARFRRELDAANRRLERFGRHVRRYGRIAAAALAGAAAAMVRSGLTVIDSQAKMAQSLGTTTESVQVLARAGELAGAQWERLEGGATRLTRRLSLFATDGSGAAADAIEQLGLNAQRLLELPLDQRIIEVTEAIRENAAASEQAAMFSQLFGDRAFTAFQRLDPSVLSQARAELERFGALVSEEDASQIERTNDAISQLGLVWRGLSNQLAVAVAPALERTADMMARLASQSGPLGAAIDWLGRNFQRVAAYAGAFAAVIAGRLVARIVAFAVGIRGAATALVALRAALIRLPFVGLVVIMTEMILKFGDLVRGAGSFGEALDLLVDVGREAFGELDKAAFGLGQAMTGTAWRIAAAFGDAFLWIGDKFKALIDTLTGTGALNSLFAITGSDFRVPTAGDILMGPLEAGVDQIHQQSQEAFAASADAFNSMTRTREAYSELVAAVERGSQTTEDGLNGATAAGRRLRETIEAAGGMGGVEGGAGGDGGGGGASGALNRIGDAARSAGDAMSDAAREGGRAWQEATNQLIQAQEKQRKAARRLAEDITGPIKRALASGEWSWRSFADAVSQIAQNLATRLINLAFKPIENAIVGALTGGGGGGSFLGSLFGLSGGFARGGAFTRAGEVHAFARGGLIDKPTVFPFAKGAGVMGEAGPEAIMPLKRGRGGRLGVETSGGQQDKPTRIVNVLDPAIVGDYLATSAGEKVIVNTIRRNRSAINA